jgi:hypothetical protein
MPITGLKRRFLALAAALHDRFDAHHVGFAFEGAGMQKLAAVLEEAQRAPTEEARTILTDTLGARGDDFPHGEMSIMIGAAAVRGGRARHQRQTASSHRFRRENPSLRWRNLHP